MSKNCLCCQRSISFFTGENFILENSEYVYCDKCFNRFAIPIGMMKYKEDSIGVTEAYQDFLQKIHSTQIPNEVLPVILAEAQNLYNLCLEKCQAINPEKYDQDQEEIRLKMEANRLLHEMQLTTGYNFEGYRITKYLGILSGGVVQGTGFLSELSADVNDLFGTESNTFAEKMMKCREAALEKLKKEAHLKQANAIIGVTFDTMTFRNNMIGILATGTAVVIEKIIEE